MIIILSLQPFMLLVISGKHRHTEAHTESHFEEQFNVCFVPSSMHTQKTSVIQNSLCSLELNFHEGLPWWLIVEM